MVRGVQSELQRQGKLLDLLGVQLGDTEDVLYLLGLRPKRTEAAADWCLACPWSSAKARLAANSCCRAWVKALPTTCTPITIIWARYLAMAAALPPEHWVQLPGLLAPAQG